jgi:SET domain-containing protein
MYTRDQILDSIRNLKTCLKPSAIPGAGVGVFSLVDIAKDSLIFDVERKDDYLFKYSEIKDLPESIRDYIMEMTDGIENGFYLDVPAFKIYTAYYVNHSHEPNVFWDRRTDELFSIRDIKSGEELTTYYKPLERNF